MKIVTRLARCLLIFLVFFCLFNKQVLGENNILISEFSPASDPEWVELYNPNESSFSLKGIVLFFDDSPTTSQKLSFCDEDQIPAKSYKLIRNQNSWLNNSGDTLILKKAGETIDSIAYGTGQLLKSPTSTQSASRALSTDLNWSISNNPGTEGEIASFNCPTPTLTPTVTPAAASTPSTSNSPTPSDTPNQTSYDNIYLSEVMVNPENNEDEWVEIYNNNNYSVSLINWYLDDLENSGSSPKSFSLDIAGKNYGVVSLSSAIFNNNGDSIRLLDFNKNLKDSFEYNLSNKGKTWGRNNFNDDYFCLQEPSKGLVNNTCPSLPITPTVTNKPTPSPTRPPFGKKDASSNASPTTYLESTGETLGMTIEADNNVSPLRILSLISFILSLLTIFSIFLKIKLRHG